MIPSSINNKVGTFVGERLFKALKHQLPACFVVSEAGVIEFNGVKITLSTYLAPTQVVTDDPELSKTLKELEQTNKELE